MAKLFERNAETAPSHLALFGTALCSYRYFVRSCCRIMVGFPSARCRLWVLHMCTQHRSYHATQAILTARTAAGCCVLYGVCCNAVLPGRVTVAAMASRLHYRCSLLIDQARMLKVAPTVNSSYIGLYENRKIVYRPKRGACTHDMHMYILYIRRSAYIRQYRANLSLKCAF